jgi:hypothetical protein
MGQSKVGEILFTKYESRLEEDKKSSFEMFAEETAATLVLQSPYVTHHLVEKGVIKPGEHSRLIPLFTANLSAQMFGAAQSKGFKITTKHAENRAAVVVNHSLENHGKILASLKERRKSEYDLFFGVRAAALVESIQCDYIAGVKMSKQAEIATAIALLRRFSKEIPNFREFLKAMSVDIRDDSALRQFADEAQIRDYIQEFYGDSLYFQRREGLIISKRTIVDTKDNVTNLSRTRQPIFTEGALVHAISRLRINTASILRKLSEKRAQGL